MAKTEGMVDVSGKDVTVRTAVASGTISIGDKAFGVVKDGSCTKGEVLAAAEIAAVQAVKSTSSLIPLCHSILIEAVDVDFVLNAEDNSVSVTVTVKSSGKTGVEMEALTGVGIACLTIYDMLKYIGKSMAIDKIKLLKKTGGKSGDYKRCD